MDREELIDGLMSHPEIGERVLDTVGDLIDYLKSLGRDRVLIYDSDGNTDHVTTNDIVIWNETDPDSPVALFERR